MVHRKRNNKLSLNIVMSRKVGYKKCNQLEEKIMAPSGHEDLLPSSTNSGRRFISSVCANVGGVKIVGGYGMLFFYHTMVGQ